MEELILRFPHLAEQIFQQMDNKSLVKSREVRISWQNLIEERNYTWLRIVNIPTILQRKNTYLHLAAKTGHLKAFKMALDEAANVNVQNDQSETPLHLACQYGQTEIVKYIMRNSTRKTDYDDCNPQNRIACKSGDLNIAGIPGHC